ncbi:zinc ribbon domain-containing protein [Streptomyces sp. NPDC006551]|uniref:Zn-ribbon domain-containing OB-fold protein n=1 Tax=Streptomyces sp. NPDC006551 TaxID=3157178 RepID=UPI0033B0E2B3
MFHTGLRSGSAVRTEESGAGAELYFQRCRWCHTTTFQRLLCPTCGSTDLAPERSEGEGVITVRRGFTAAHADLWPVHMAEGFVVRCRVDGPLHAVRPGVRVKLSSGGTVPGQPVVRLCEEVPLDGWI